MWLFVTEVAGPATADQFAYGFRENLQQGFKSREVIAEAWVDFHDGRGMIIQGWVDEASPELLNDIVRGAGWEASSRVFRSIADVVPGGPAAWFRLPQPGRVTLCEMPNNKHQIGTGRASVCPSNHTFSPDHNIRNCVICGNALT